MSDEAYLAENEDQAVEEEIVPAKVDPNRKFKVWNRLDRPIKDASGKVYKPFETYYVPDITDVIQEQVDRNNLDWDFA